MGKPIRVLVAKPGLDGHDVGAKLVCRALMDAGMEVVYSGLRQTPVSVAQTALEEGVDVLGLSILSGAHLPLCEKIKAELESRNLGDILWLVGGNIPGKDEAALKEMGVDAVFPTGSSFEDLIAFIHGKVNRG